jgi:xanthine dehydrogenase large subunit
MLNKVSGSVKSGLGTPDTYAHVRAESPFIDDLPEPAGLLHAAVLTSPVAHGEIRSLDVSAARQSPGVAGVFTADDIPGENQIGGIIQDEELLAKSSLHYVGQPIAFIVADTVRQAREALRQVILDVDELPAVFDAREAAARGDLIAPSRSLACGDVEQAWQSCAVIVEGCAESGAQEHVYLETQATLAIPQARERLLLYSGTQSPAAVQRTVASVLACNMNDIEVEVQRIGGAFGGKEDQGTPWAVMAALGAWLLNRPVKIILRRDEDMAMTGKRHPYSSDYRLGLDGDGKFVAFEVTYYQNSGAAADLSTAIMERTLFHATNSYYIPNVRATGMCCRTNLPPFTAFRGFGGPQAMFVMETAVAAAAQKLGRPAHELQRINLLNSGDELPYGMRLEHSNAIRSFDEVCHKFNFDDRLAAIKTFNAGSRYIKRGIALMPICFGISFTNTGLNQAGALVHIYSDGSISVNTGVVEMGQGVLTKIRRIVATALGVPESAVRMESTNTTRVANMSPTAASTATDLNGMAAQMACRILISRLKNVAAGMLSQPDISAIKISDGVFMDSTTKHQIGWCEVVESAYWQRVDLSAHAFYATPDINYDKSIEKGSPFAYHVFGTAMIIAEVDVLRGTALIKSVKVVHDAGKSLDLLVDRGQAEGGIVQGIGWVTLEDICYDDRGRLLSNSLATYKVPDIHFVPHDIEVLFLEDSLNPHAVMQTKGIGEPPFMYGIGAFFAIRDAMRAECELPTAKIAAPLTNEHILMLLDNSAV